jgi:hypothetical protein
MPDTGHGGVLQWIAITNKEMGYRMSKKIIFLALLLLAVVSVPVQAQSLGGAFDREDVPILPSGGNWWTPDTGPGRWGLQIEVQTGTVFPLGFLGSAIFSYSSDDPSDATWYSISQPYQYNPNWRQDGYIGRMVLTLNQSRDGICLLCEDGSAAGESIVPDVSTAEIIFRDSLNAELHVGNVVHQLVKSQWGDGVEAYLDEFWRRIFRFNIEATFSGFNINGGSLIAPQRANGTVTYESQTGWEVYNYTIPTVIENIDNGVQAQAFQDFQLLVHTATNQYRVIYPRLSEDRRLEFKLFPQNRFIVEGRLLQGVGFPSGEDVTGNMLFMTTPSLQPASDGSQRPWY